jgi:serine protease Do
LGACVWIAAGIISAKGRTHVNIIAEHNPSLAGLTYEDFIQTDAAINPGNSGGPLVNMKGSVIGINSAIATSNGGFSGIGFSIPSNEVKYVANALIKSGKVVRGYLGVSISDVRHQSVREVAETFGYHGKHGVLVQQIEPGTPAADGGLKKGDIITKLNGKKVMTMNQLRDQIAMTHPGDKVTLGVFRNGKNITLTFPLGTQPQTLDQVALGGGGSSSVAPMASKKLGVTIAPVTPAIAKADHMATPRGVVVTNVAPNGLAASVGVAPGDIILSVQGVHVNSPDAFDGALKKLDLAKGVRLSLRSPSGVEQFVFVKSGN